MAETINDKIPLTGNDKGSIIVVNEEEEMRCPHVKKNGRRCNSLFFKGEARGKIQIKCRKCHETLTIKMM